METDLELFERWCDGDRTAGNQLFQRHFDSIYRFFSNKLSSDCDELIQNTFLACVRSRDSFRKQSSFRTYLFTIARHELYGYLRKRKQRGEELDFSNVSLADLGTTPSGRMARNQELQRLLHALRTLPVEQQVILELHYWQDMGAPELAEVMGIAQPAMRARLSRARQALRACIERMVDAPLPAHASLEDLDAWARRMREQSPLDSPATDLEP